MTFVYDPERQVTKCGDTGLTAWMRHGRGVNEIVFRDSQGNRVDGVWCRDETRPILPAEAAGRDLCPEVIIWHVAWGGRQDIGTAKRPVSRDLVRRYLEFWQSVKGVGCWVEGVPRRALVEVKFGPRPRQSLLSTLIGKLSRPAP